MFKNPIEKEVQFSAPLIKKFIGKGYVYDEIVGTESTTVRLRNDKIAGFLGYQSQLKNLTTNNRA